MVVQADRSLLVVTADATKEFSADINKATSALCAATPRGQWDRSSSGTENSLKLQGSLVDLQRQRKE